MHFVFGFVTIHGNTPGLQYVSPFNRKNNNSKHTFNRLVGPIINSTHSQKQSDHLVDIAAQVVPF